MTQEQEPTARILPLQYVKGVGPRRAEALAKDGIVTYLDVVMRAPRGYVSRSAEHNIGEMYERYRQPNLWGGSSSDAVRVTSEVSIVATVSSVRKKRVGKGKEMLEAVVTDGSGVSLSCIFWNQLAYYQKLMQEGHTCLVSGVPQFDTRWNQLAIHHPEIEVVESDDVERYRGGSILPKYSLSQGLRNAGVTAGLLRSVVEQVIEHVLPLFPEIIPKSLLESRSLMNRQEAIRELHAPTTLQQVERARYRMKYEELFMFELMLAARRRSRRRPEAGLPVKSASPRARTVVERLPYTLTAAQKRVIREIIGDMTSGLPMNRLLQGDVGSGKTVVAVLCMLNAIDNGYQTLLMAPTEILAEQHLHGITEMLEGLDINIAHLVGGMRKKARSTTLEMISTGHAQIVIGTHAVFETDCVYKNLGLIVIDEQHRFGVAQRAELRKLGRASHTDGPRTPHLLVMSATPIPRTLSMTLYGDLDASVIDELPPGRKPIQTSIVFESQLSSIYDAIRNEIAVGRQAYIVYPLVEKSEKVDAKSAVEHFEFLRDTVFADLRVGLLHGQMAWPEKEEAMRAFLRRDFDVLVSTTVIEVGIDVPNATIMLIENAERFGLSQLHQLRGRVGRGGDQSYCYLATKDHFRYHVSRAISAEDQARSVVRLKTMEETTDGFKIAEVDLRLRGPGDMMGTRQSGLPEFRFADIVADAPLIAQTRTDAFALLEQDPHLRMIDHQAAKDELIKSFDVSGLAVVA